MFTVEPPSNKVENVEKRGAVLSIFSASLRLCGEF
jgi:hypothetical protein